MTVDGDQDVDVDVVVVGAGPVGLTLANILGLQGVSTLVVEERDGCFQVAAVIPQFVGRQGGQGVFWRVYAWGLL